MVDMKANIFEIQYLCSRQGCKSGCE